MRYRNLYYKEVVVEVTKVDQEGNYHLKVISGNIKNCLAVGTEFYLSKEIFNKYYILIEEETKEEIEKKNFNYFYHGKLIRNGSVVLEGRGIHKSLIKACTNEDINGLEISAVEGFKNKYWDDFVADCEFIIDSLSFLYED